MRRSIAAVLLSASLILAAAGCEVSAAQKQAAARFLTSAILNSVLLIESRGHHADDPVAGVEIAAARSAGPPSESAAGEPPRAASLRSAQPGGSVTPAEDQSRRKLPSETAAADTPPLPESPQVIRATAIAAVAGGLTPSTAAHSADASALPVRSDFPAAIRIGLKVNTLTACLQNAVRATEVNAVTATALSAAVRQTVDAVSIDALPVDESRQQADAHPSHLGQRPAR